MIHKLTLEERKKFINLRRSFTGPVLGITGNVGKTTTLEMIRTVLEKKGKVLKHQNGHGKWRNNISTLKKLSPKFDYALFEFDFYRGNNFAEILRLIKPNVGIVTNFGDAHLSYIGEMVDVALQKSGVVKYLARDGIAILNKDDELSAAIGKYIKTKNIVKFGLSQNAEFFASDIEHLGPQGTKLILNNNYEVIVPIYSIGDIYNFLAATATLSAMEFEIEMIIDCFKNHFSLPSGRGKLHSINGYYLIDESYEATPRSVAKTARALVGFKPHTEKLIYIIGDMIESGPNIEQIHLNMGHFISALPIDCLVTVGNYARYIGKGVSLIQAKEKEVVSCNSINDILKTMDNVLEKKSAIAVQGVGQVAMRRLLSYIEKKT